MIRELSDNDLYYLRSILRHLREFRGLVSGPSLGGEALADNIDWLDCFISVIEQERTRVKP